MYTRMSLETSINLDYELTKSQPKLWQKIAKGVSHARTTITA